MSIEGDSPTLLGSSAAITATRQQIRSAARLEEPVLVLGETGVGKELVARAVHAASDRCDRPLQVINCAGVSADLLASELFGHRRGAFTGAAHSRAGRLRAAARSIVVLDEISETPERFQATLLRTIESGEIQPVGSDRAARVDVRFIATSNRPLEWLAAGSGFRLDLFYRLAAIVITVAPLRHRLEDVEELAAHFLGALAARYGVERTLGDAALSLLSEHAFPGNVRELRQIVTRAYAAGTGTSITAAQTASAILPTEAVTQDAAGAPEEHSLEQVIRDHIQRTLVLAEDNISQAARMLQVPRSTLQHYLAKYGIDAQAARRDRRAAAR